MTQIPRALHVDQGHPIAQRLLISVNGIEQQKVISYDIDAAIVVRYESDEDGFIVAKGDNVSVETVRGDVQVRLAE